MSLEQDSPVFTDSVSEGAVPASAPIDDILELTGAPQPFLDWALIEGGRLSWAGEMGEEPRTARAVREEQIRGVPVGVPSGVSIRTQPATRVGRIFKDTVAWEAGLRLGACQFFDEDMYRLWYHAAAGIVYAQSADGLAWQRPIIDFVPYKEHESTSLMPPVDNTGDRKIALHEGSALKDPACGQEERYKMVFTAAVTDEELRGYQDEMEMPASYEAHMKKKVTFYAYSPDGFCWAMHPEPIMLHAGDPQVIMAFDAQLQRYVAYMGMICDGRRCVGRSETGDFRHWPLPTPVLALGPADPPYLDLFTHAYAVYPDNPGVRVMFPTVYDRSCNNTTIRMAVSRDGRLWHWVPGPPVLVPGAPTAFDGGCVFSNAGLVRGANGRLALLYTGSQLPHRFPKTGRNLFQIGSAQWEPDRLAALESPERGEFSTIRLRLRGNKILLNANVARAGELRVEVRDEQYRPVGNRTFTEADSLVGDHDWTPVTWLGNPDLSPCRDSVVYLRFRLRAAKLFGVKAGE